MAISEPLDPSCWIHLAPSWRASWAHLGLILDHLGPILDPSWTQDALKMRK